VCGLDGTATGRYFAWFARLLEISWILCRGIKSVYGWLTITETAPVIEFFLSLFGLFFGKTTSPMFRAQLPESFT
jgi:hypothetical protein